MNDEPGKYFRSPIPNRFEGGRRAHEGAGCILIVDPILGSRFSLAQAAAFPGYVVNTASTIRTALSYLNEGGVALIIVDQHLGECDGLDFLVEVRGRYPESRRALVTGREGIEFVRDAISRAGLSFLLSKPWSSKSLRKTIGDVLSQTIELKGWSRPMGEGAAARPALIERGAYGRRLDSDRQHEILLRGLLSGLNSCEFEAEVFELLHTELALPFRVREWLWVDEGTSVATRISGDWPAESGLPISELGIVERDLLAKARRSSRVTRLDQTLAQATIQPTRKICLGLAIRNQDQRAMTCLIWADEEHCVELALLLRELQSGLHLVFRRIRLAQARALAALRLAQRVSDDLRLPVGALTHAINRLRGEAERAGMPIEWIDRVSSESERVVQAVEDIEGEIRTSTSVLSSSVI